MIRHWQRETGYDYYNAVVRTSLAEQFEERETADEERERIVREAIDQAVDDYLKGNDAASEQLAWFLLRELRFINDRGQPLQMIPLLEPDPELLDQPLYH